MTAPDPGPQIRARLARPSEGTPALAIAGGLDVGPTGQLQFALDEYGGHIPFYGIPGAAGWCFVATADDQIVGVLYACSPMRFIHAHTPREQPHLIRAISEFEIFAVAEPWRGRGVGKALLHYAESHFRARGNLILVAKVDTADMSVLRWYRHRGYTILQPGESATLNLAATVTAMDAGDGPWRLAIKPLSNSVVRRGANEWLLAVPYPR